MINYEVTKKLSDACIAHRLKNGYVGKCNNIHGHNYSFEVTIKSKFLNKFDMVIDFGDIKKLFDSWIQENWDHAVIVSNNDKIFIDFLKSEKQRFYLVDDNYNTTAERMSRILFDKFSDILKNLSVDLVLSSVKVWETATSYAEFRGYEND